MRGGDDFVARVYTKCPQGNVNRVRSVCAGNATLHAERSCPCLLEGFNVPPANVSRLGDDLSNGTVDLMFDRQVLRVQVHKGDSHGENSEIRNQESLFRRVRGDEEGVRDSPHKFLGRLCLW
jgi:hypothetical protein